MDERDLKFVRDAAEVRADKERRDLADGLQLELSRRDYVERVLRANPKHPKHGIEVERSANDIAHQGMVERSLAANPTNVPVTPWAEVPTDGAAARRAMQERMLRANPKHPQHTGEKKI